MRGAHGEPVAAFWSSAFLRFGAQGLAAFVCASAAGAAQTADIKTASKASLPEEAAGSLVFIKFDFLLKNSLRYGLTHAGCKTN